MLVGIILLKAVRVIVPEFPGMDHFLELGLMSFRLCLYAMAVALIFPYWLHFALVRNIPFYFAHIMHFTFLHILSFSFTNFFIYEYSMDRAVIHFFRQELFNLILSVPYVLYFKPEIYRRLAKPGCDLPIWRPIRVKPSTGAVSEETRDAAAAEAIENGEGTRQTFEWIADALTIQAQNQYVIVRMENGSQMVRMTMKDAIAQLDEKQGVRIHRSWWIRRSLVKSVQRDGPNLKVVATNGEIYPLSKSNLSEIQSIIAQNAPVQVAETI
jgi:hypothetical protein